MLDAVCKYLPSPMDKEGIQGIHPDDAELLEEDQVKILRKPDVKEPFAALAFKIATDPFVGRLAFFRAYSGRLDAGSYVLNTRSGNKERISRIYQMHANKQNPIDYIEAGDIGAAVGFKDIKTGDTLCDEKHPIILESMKFPAPVIGIFKSYCCSNISGFDIIDWVLFVSVHLVDTRNSFFVSRTSIQHIRTCVQTTRVCTEEC